MAELMEMRRRMLLAQEGFLPPAYQKCDYLQTTGFNSRIDTGVPGNDETLVFDFDYATIVRQAYAAAFGNYLGETSRCWRLINPGGTGDARNYLCTALNRRANSTVTVNVVPSEESMVGKRINFLVSFGKCVSRYGDYTETVTADPDGTAEISTRNIAIGASHPALTGGTIVGRFWHFKIWRGGRLIRNYVPCYRKADNKAGFYDTVNHTFNPSIGTAEFIAGND